MSMTTPIKTALFGHNCVLNDNYYKREKRKQTFFHCKADILCYTDCAKLYFVSTTPLTGESGFLSQAVNSTVVLIWTSLSTNYE